MTQSRQGYNEAQSRQGYNEAQDSPVLSLLLIRQNHHKVSQSMLCPISMSRIEIGSKVS